MLPSIQTLSENYYKTNNDKNYKNFDRTIWLINNTINAKFRMKDFFKIFELVFKKRCPESEIRAIINAAVENKLAKSYVPPRNKKFRGSVPKEYLFSVFLGEKDTHAIRTSYRSYRNNIQKNYLKRTKKNKTGIKKIRIPKKILVSEALKKINLADIPTLEKFCLTNGLTRDMPYQEQKICEEIINMIYFRIPHGGMALYTGTPTPICVSTHSTHRGLTLDNYDVAMALKRTTSTLPSIIVGDLVDPVKAELKVKLWKGFYGTSKFNIKSGPVNAFGFISSVTEIATECEKQKVPCKVVLMTSGLWSGCKKSNKAIINSEFESAGNFLIKRFSNLHILAMSSKNHVEFEMVYIHS